MARLRHEPTRTCLGCGVRDDKSKLIRLTARNSGSLKIDERGNGRGGYLHRLEPCWRAFVKRKSVYRAFHLEITREAKEQLVRELIERGLE